MNKDAEGHYKVGMSNIKSKIWVKEVCHPPVAERVSLNTPGSLVVGATFFRASDRRGMLPALL